MVVVVIGFGDYKPKPKGAVEKKLTVEQVLMVKKTQ